MAKLLEEDNFKYSLIVFDSEYDLKQYSELWELPDTMEHYGLVLDYDDVTNTETINCEEDDFDLYYQTFNVTAEDILDCYTNNEWNSVYQTTNNAFVQSLIERIYYEFTSNFREG